MKFLKYQKFAIGGIVGISLLFGGLTAPASYAAEDETGTEPVAEQLLVESPEEATASDALLSEEAVLLDSASGVKQLTDYIRANGTRNEKAGRRDPATGKTKTVGGTVLESTDDKDNAVITLFDDNILAYSAVLDLSDANGNMLTFCEIGYDLNSNQLMEIKMEDVSGNMYVGYLAMNTDLSVELSSGVATIDPAKYKPSTVMDYSACTFNERVSMNSNLDGINSNRKLQGEEAKKNSDKLNRLNILNRSFLAWAKLVKKAGVSLADLGFSGFGSMKNIPYAVYDGYTFYRDDAGVVTCFRGKKAVINEFQCDGIYTYYFQFDGTCMMDRLSYHPDGVHVIYFDKYGHEVFSNFANVKKTISGDAVDDYCFFDMNGYLYVDVLTYDVTGTLLYYANPYGVMERGKWFQFSDTVKWADGTPAEGIAGGYGCANEDASLKTNTDAIDWEGRKCYLQGNGVAKY